MVKLTMVTVPAGDVAVTLNVLPEQVLPSAAVRRTECTVPSWAARSELGTTLPTNAGTGAAAVHSATLEVVAVKVVPLASGKHFDPSEHCVTLLARKFIAPEVELSAVRSALLLDINRTIWLRTVVAAVWLSQVLDRAGVAQEPVAQESLPPRGNTNSPAS